MIHVFAQKEKKKEEEENLLLFVYTTQATMREFSIKLT